MIGEAKSSTEHIRSIVSTESGSKDLLVAPDVVVDAKLHLSLPHMREAQRREIQLQEAEKASSSE